MPTSTSIMCAARAPGPPPTFGDPRLSDPDEPVMVRRGEHAYRPGGPDEARALEFADVVHVHGAHVVDRARHDPARRPDRQCSTGARIGGRLRRGSLARQ